MKTLDDATEQELMLAWLKRRREEGDRLFTRVGRTETRHVCHYAASSLNELRDEVVRPEMTSRHTILELQSIIASLQGLIGYLEGTRGAFSAMPSRDRNAGTSSPEA